MLLYIKPNLYACIQTIIHTVQYLWNGNDIMIYKEQKERCITKVLSSPFFLPLGGEAITGHYNNILATLSAALSKETFPRALDNICGAVARLISTSPSNVPLEQVSW